MANRVKKYGYGGITQLNKEQLKKLFEGYEKVD